MGSGNNGEGGLDEDQKDQGNTNQLRDSNNNNESAAGNNDGGSETLPNQNQGLETTNPLNNPNPVNNTNNNNNFNTSSMNNQY